MTQQEEIEQLRNQLSNLQDAIFEVNGAFRDLFRPKDRGQAFQALSSAIWKASHAALFPLEIPESDLQKIKS